MRHQPCCCVGKNSARSHQWCARPPCSRPSVRSPEITPWLHSIGKFGPNSGAQVAFAPQHGGSCCRWRDSRSGSARRVRIRTDRTEHHLDSVSNAPCPESLLWFRWLKPSAIIAEFEKIAVGIEDCQYQGQRLAEIRATRAARLLTCIEHGSGEDLADDRDLVVCGRRSVLEPRLPPDELPLTKGMWCVHGVRQFGKAPPLLDGGSFVCTARQELNGFVSGLRMGHAVTFQMARGLTPILQPMHVRFGRILDLLRKSGELLMRRKEISGDGAEAVHEVV